MANHTTPTYHVHFGAGKLGLGLVLPILARTSTPIAVFQRPNVNPEWSVTLGSQSLSLFVNDERLLDLYCVRDSCTKEQLKRLLAEGKHLFVSTTRVDFLQEVLRRAESFSSAVGPCGGRDFLKGLSFCPLASSSKATTKKPVFLFENDGGLVTNIQEGLRSIAPDVFEVIPVMCDRICTHRSITADRLQVRTEEYAGTAVLKLESSLQLSTCFERYRSGENAPQVVVTSCEAEQHFFYRRKFMLVNGLHMILSMMAYDQLNSHSIPIEKWKASPVLEWWDKSNGAEKRKTLEVLIHARIYQLLAETPAEVLEKAYGTRDAEAIFEATEAYANLAFSRVMQQKEDTVGRLLDISNPAQLITKHRDRFCDLKHFLERRPREDHPILSRKLPSAYAGAIQNVGTVLNILQERFLRAVFTFDASTPQQAHAFPLVPAVVVSWILERDRPVLQMLENWEFCSDDKASFASLQKSKDKLNQMLASQQHMITINGKPTKLASWRSHSRSLRLLFTLFSFLTSSSLTSPASVITPSILLNGPKVQHPSQYELVQVAKR